MPSAAAITEVIEVLDKDAFTARVTSHIPNELYPYISTVLYVGNVAEGSVGTKDVHVQVRRRGSL